MAWLPSSIENRQCSENSNTIIPTHSRANVISPSRKALPGRNARTSWPILAPRLPDAHPHRGICHTNCRRKVAAPVRPFARATLAYRIVRVRLSVKQRNLSLPSATVRDPNNRSEDEGAKVIIYSRMKVAVLEAKHRSRSSVCEM